MKRIFFMALIACLTFALAVSAEVKQGDWLVGIGTDLGFMNSKITYTNGRKEKINEFYIDLEAEKFITDNISLGGWTAYYKLSEDQKSEMWYIAASGKYYFQPAEKLNPFINISVGFSDWHRYGEGLILETGLGALYFVNDKVSIKGELAFRRYDMNDGNIDKENRLGINFGLGIKL